MTPAEESSDEESAISSSDSYEMAHTENEPSTSKPLKPLTEIKIEHEVLIERPDESDSSTDDYTDDTDDDDNARLQKV